MEQEVRGGKGGKAAHERKIKCVSGLFGVR